MEISQKICETKATQINPVTEERFQTQNKNTSAVENNQNNNIPLNLTQGESLLDEKIE